MKKLAFLFYLMSCFQMVNAAELPDDVVDYYLQNPTGYFFDDGGNMDFGHGFFIRRFKVNGQPRVCHKNNVMYGGWQPKCVDSARKKCLRYKDFPLTAKMSGVRYFCKTRNGGRYYDELDPIKCKRYSEVPFNYGPVVKVEIYKTAKMSDKNSNGDRRSDGYLGHAFLTIPRCRN